MRYLLTVISLLAVISLSARENIGMEGRVSNHYKALASDCNDATSQIDLDINNVRARMLGAGDMWWDLNDGLYEIPKVDASTGCLLYTSPSPRDA